MLKKLSMLLFLLGAITSILGGAFTSTPETENLKIIFLIIFGVFVGLINISQEQEYGFLLASGVFVICAASLNALLNQFLLLSALNVILQNFIIFISPAAIIVAFRVIVEFASQSELDVDGEEESLVQFYTRLSKRERIWDLVILFAVSVTLILLILQMFYNTSAYLGVITLATYIIAVIFIVDLIVLYNRAKDLKAFFKTGWLDIIAAIPFGAVFQLAKTFRFIKILKVVSKTQKVSKVAHASKLSNISKASKIGHINQPAKFFSKKSGFNKYIDPKDRKKK